VHAIGRRSRDLRTKRRAFDLLVRSGADVRADLTAEDPQTRLAAAAALGGEHADAVEQVCVAIVNDTSLSRDLRREAMHRIRDAKIKVAACFELALAGDDQAAGNLRWVMTSDAINALERLVVEATSPEVRAVAARVLKSRREIEDMKQTTGG
jgi:hypothetical protein